uniref:Uncharacterized protein n=1 Tax=Romanomermis culicivorax TaxID=13658 RepID=A0A915I9G5_ROMCU
MYNSAKRAILDKPPNNNQKEHLQPDPRMTPMIPLKKLQFQLQQQLKSHSPRPTEVKQCLIHLPHPQQLIVNCNRYQKPAEREQVGSMLVKPNFESEEKLIKNVKLNVVAKRAWEATQYVTLGQLAETLIDYWEWQREQRVSYNSSKGPKAQALELADSKQKGYHPGDPPAIELENLGLGSSTHTADDL